MGEVEAGDGEGGEGQSGGLRDVLKRTLEMTRWHTGVLRRASAWVGPMVKWFQGLSKSRHLCI